MLKALSRSGLLGLVGLTAIGLAGCSSRDTFEQPAPVPEIVDRVEFDEIWDMQVGEGHDEQLMQLGPLVADDRVYAAAADGTVVAATIETGKVHWWQYLDTSLLAGIGGDQQRLYLVTGNAELVVLSITDGSVLWEAALPNEVIASPRSNGDIVVVQTVDGNVLAFDGASGEKRWQYDGVVPVLSLRASAPPLVGSDMTLVSFSSGRLFALASDTGQPLWQYTVGEPQGRTELERLVDVTSEPLVLESAALVTGYQGKLALVDLRTGQEIWSRASSSLHTPAIADGNIYVSESNGHLVAYEGSSRRAIWTQDKLAWRQLSRPVVFDDYLVVGDFEGYIHILARDDGRLLGQLEYDDEGLWIPMQRLQDKLLVYGNSGKLSLFELNERD
ncbi:outer membrane protein assembly factor BamB [Marinobacter sp. SS21]|uniref:outer membrane protein assembly factor BamB n=1 Tax=Marinobacter sp. SS21 TaxID=2979460 RepID=UPI002330289D|nr:outer membrane protein assembly factor BamB [Marinobacter sp. SS21]MDC0663306.1 outer membrane protein assembly factor BamB [Marinobacter sp. SS21]